MSKTPEEMAEEYADDWHKDCDYPEAILKHTKKATETAFLAGYQAAKEETNFATPGKWISVKNRLPNIGEWVLVNGPEICQRIEPPSASWGAKYAWNTDHETFYYPKDITHWMSLPEPPKEEE